MDRARAHDILASHGGDPARWPADERAALAALIAGDTALARAADQARQLDVALVDWARAPVADPGFDVEALATRLPAAAPRRRWWPAAMAGGAMAATLAGVLLLQAPATQPTPATPVVAQADTDAYVWSTLFMPTPEEEQMI